MEDLWVEPHPDALFCCSCRSRFGSAAPIRTFRLHHADPDNNHLAHTKIIKTPSDESIIIYDRHLQCLLQAGVKYSAISHVWDPEVSYMQCLGKDTSQPLSARREVFQSAQFIYHSLLKSGAITELDEIWYDYVSVPQWTDGVKGRILLAIPDIYGCANMTIIRFKDLRPGIVQLLYHGQTTDERVKAVTGICNLDWFTRVWTATEYVRSSRVMSMDGEGNVCPEGADPVFLNKLHEVWSEEAPKHSSIHHLEARAGIGRNLVPWNLGPLLDMGKAKSSNFGQAFALLSKRRCRSNYDFLHALLGLVEPTSDRPLGHDFQQDYTRIARLCLAIGDYSPLLMTPRIEEHHGARQWDIKQGLNDLGIWPLGAQEQLPDFH
ncbi:MAG: hypothetical protein Q9184_004653 [Pyrenodesmia sp. 2 TL-2023]